MFLGQYVGLYLISILFAMWGRKKKTEYTYYCRIAKLVSVVVISIALKLANLAHFLEILVYIATEQ